MASSKRRSSYTAEQRKAVLVDVRTIGVCATATKHKVPQTCVSRWALAAGVKRATGEQSSSPLDSPLAQSGSVGGEARAAAEKVSAAAARIGEAIRSRAAKLYTPSQKALALEDAAKDGVTVAAKKHGVSRFSIYEWQRRLAKAAVGQGPSPTSGAAPKEIEEKRDAEILGEWKNHPGLGPSQVVNQLRRKAIKVSVHTARRVMEDAGYRPPKVERQKHDRGFEAIRPNHLWHLDFVQRYIGSSTTFTLILIDDCSRYVVGHGVDDSS